MFRSLTAILLLLAFAVQTFESAFLVLDYFTNTGSFAKNCENKQRPQLHCNGKCLLMKKLKEQENKEQQNTAQKVNKNEVVSSRFFFISIDALFIEKEMIRYASPDEAAVISRPRSFFHPPNV